MKISSKWLAAVLIFLLVVFAIIGFANSSSWVDSKIDIVKPEEVPEELFKPVSETLKSQIAKYENIKIWKVPLDELEEMIRKEDRVKDVRVMRSWPREIQVKVWPHQPIFVVIDNKGVAHPVTKDARVLNAIAIREVHSMPIVRGAQFLAQKELRQSAVKLVNAFEQAEALNNQEISEITHSQKDGFRVYLTKSGSEIRLGDSDFDLKLKRVGKVISYLDGQQIKGRVIDARYSKKVLVRVRNAP